MVKKPDTISVADRFEFGEFTVKEACALKATGPTRLYADIAAGRLPVEKRGRSTRIRGPILKRYVPGVGLVDQAD
jgi:hypothetical protein